MKILFTYILFGLGSLFSAAYAQTDFYEIETIREIKIYFEEDNWDHILDSLYGDDMQERLIGDVSIDGIYYENAGIRYKGYSSASADRVKNPLNIKLDFVHKDQNHEGLDKIKLSNVIHDPSFVREVLSYEIARKYMPASRANFANVYINDVLIGLYSNVESVEADFLENHFESSSNTFFKGNPETLDLDGENSNLSNSHGTHSSDYHPYYTQKSDNIGDWNVLYGLIKDLNETPDELDVGLNIDRALWMHAFNYSMINFDSYVGYAQNYYLYQGDNGQFNPIIWDLNQSFGSYRLTDASTYWAGFSILEAKNADPLQHFLSFSITPRPLMTVLFENETYRKMYLAHLKTIMEENFNDADYLARATAIQSIIETDVMNDPNKFYSDADFYTNLDTTVSDLIDYVGLRDLMENRAIYLATYPGMTGEPTIVNTTDLDLDYNLGETITFTAELTDADEIFCHYRFIKTDIFTQLAMNDDGVDGDELADDGVYSVNLENASNHIDFYFYAQNETAGKFSPKRAAYEFYSLSTELQLGDLVINEFVAKNLYDQTDEWGELEDWVELYNNSNGPISTAGLFISDTIGDLFKSEVGDMLIPANSYKIFWADEDGIESLNHWDFKLNEEGEQIVLSTAEGIILDSVTFGHQSSIFSYGRYPNGTGDFTEMFSTMQYENQAPNDTVFHADFHAFPIPVRDILYINTSYEAPYTLTLTNSVGQTMKQIEIDWDGLVEWDVSALGDGMYIITLERDDFTISKKIIITD
ncbi:MAG: T9SS type A sorting domain-containing protein [Crocinitomix sp.]|nr:T9SS type A sorting domain-containing protein [Crocinitomix sp.]